MARHELADQVTVLLQRVYPGELSKEELETQSGLGNKDLRAALDSLSEEGELDPLADGYRWRDPTGAEHPPPDTPAEEEQAPDAPLATTLDPGGDVGRIILGVALNFSPAGDDEATAKVAGELAEQVQNVLGTALPDLGALVRVRRLEVYDKPRVLFDVEEGATDAKS